MYFFELSGVVTDCWHLKSPYLYLLCLAFVGERHCFEFDADPDPGRELFFMPTRILP